MSETEELLTEAAAWAAKKKRPFDAEVASDIVEMRTVYDALEPGTWPEGSAESLVLVRWPAHGPLDLPAPEVLEGTLDTFWRFLRGTGRMRASSAAPGDLTRELRRALPSMADACADRRNWAQGRVFQEFGQRIGVDLRNCSSQAELEAAMGRVMQAWNELPQEQRVALMPDPSPRSVEGIRLTDLVNGRAPAPWDEGPADDPWNDGSDEFGDEPIRPPDLHIAAREVSSAPFTRTCLLLAEWVGTRREITDSGVLRPALAREAYEHLGLLDDDLERLDGIAPRDELRAELTSWRTAKDCPSLHRVWLAAQGAGLVTAGATTARRTSGLPSSDEAWCDLGLDLFMSVLHTDGELCLSLLIPLLTAPLLEDDGRIDGRGVIDAWIDEGVDEIAADVDDPDILDDMDDHFRGVATRALELFDTLGLWTRGRRYLTLTEFGRLVGIALVDLLEQAEATPNA